MNEILNTIKIPALVLLILLIVLLIVIKCSRNIYIILSCLPRDIRGLLCFAKVNFFVFRCKYTDQTAASMFDKTVKRYPNKACFLYQDEIWSYKRVQEFSMKIAKYFQQQGYQKGDVVGLFMENRPEYVAIWLGLGRIGVVTSLLNYNLRMNPLKHCAQVSNCKAIIYGEELQDAITKTLESDDNEFISKLKLFCLSDGQKRLQSKFSSIDLNQEMSHITSEQAFSFPQVKNADAAFLIFTSGTTGLPKAVKMTYTRFFTYATMAICGKMNASKGDVLYTPVPLYHVQGGMIGVSCAIFHGVTQVIARKFSATNFWKDCDKYGVTHCQYLGEMIRYLQAQPPCPEDGSHKVRIFFGNGLTNALLWKSFTERFNGVIMIEIYGSTEGNCSMINMEGIVGATCYLPVWLYPVLPVFIARIDSTTGEILRNKKGLLQHVKCNEVGILLGKIVRGNPLREFEGYVDASATTAKIIRSVKSKGDEWFNTGDTFTVDEFGRLYFKDRLGDTFRWKGENVSTTEVEQVIGKATNYSSSVCVYGVEIPGMEGKCGMAAISDPDSTLSVDSIAEEMLKQLPRYAVPLFLRIVKGELDMTGTFKLEKVQLQKEGFNIDIVKDDLFILMDGRNYVQFSRKDYDDVCNGKIRL